MISEPLIITFTVAMVAALVLVSWTWLQAFLNRRSTNDPELRRFAWVKLMRESILWIGQADFTLIYLLAAIFQPPRPAWVSLVITIGLLVGSAVFVLMSWHDYTEMRLNFKEKDG